MKSENIYQKLQILGMINQIIKMKIFSGYYEYFKKKR